MTHKLAPCWARGKDEWGTPRDFFAALHAEFRFTLDPCATAALATCKRYFDIFDNGLRQPWGGARCFVNPPYSQITAWVAKCAAEAQRGALVVALVAARTDTAWWHDNIMRAHELRLVRGRLRFIGGKYGAPFPSAVVVWRPGRPATAPLLSAYPRNPTPLDGLLWQS